MTLLLWFALFESARGKKKEKKKKESRSQIPASVVFALETAR